MLDAAVAWNLFGQNFKIWEMCDCHTEIFKGRLFNGLPWRGVFEHIIKPSPRERRCGARVRSGG